VSVAKLVRQYVYQAYGTVRIGGSGYEVHWLPLSDAFYLVDLYRRFRRTICLRLHFHYADKGEKGSF